MRRAVPLALLLSALLAQPAPLARQQTGDPPAIGTQESAARPGAAPPEEAGREEDAIARIRQLMEGTLPDDFAVQSLFEVDLLNEEAVALRRDDLEGLVLHLEKRLGDATGDEAARLAPRLDLARLRLAFLRLPLPERHRVNEAEQRRRGLARRREEAQREQAAAGREAEEAEQARRRASQVAESASSAAAQSVASERARAESSRAAIASREADLAGRAAEATHVAELRLETVLEHERKTGEIEPGSPDALPLVEAIAADFTLARENLEQALGALGTPSSVPRFTPGLDLSEITDPAMAPELADLEHLRNDLERRTDALLVREKEARWQEIEHHAEEAIRLDRLRAQVLARLPAGERSRLLGWTRDGLAQLRGEVEFLVLLARYYVSSRLHGIERLPSMARDLFSVGSLTYLLLKLGLVLIAALFVSRKGSAMVESARRQMFRRIRGRGAVRRGNTLLTTLEALRLPIIFLATVWAARYALGAAAGLPEIRLLFLILFWVAWYRLAVRVLHVTAIAASRRYGSGFDSRMSLRVLASLRTFLRIVFLVGAILAISELFVGRGYVHGLVRTVGAISLVVAGLAILQRWREDVCDLYLTIAPETGTLARLVRSTRERWYGFFVALASLAFVLLRGGVALLRDFALGFDQTRKGLAFLFRRRMEKQAERSGYADVEEAEIPPELAAAFSEEPLNGDDEGVDHYPGLDKLLAALDRAAERQTGGSFLLVGEYGVGKSSWLSKAMAQDALSGATRIDLSERILDHGRLEALILERLGGGEEGVGEGGLGPWLENGPRRIVVIDACQNLMLRAVNGYGALERFFDLLDITQNRVFWICAFNRHAWMTIAALRKANHPFRREQMLTPWDEERIGELIRRRTAHCGVTLSFDDLVVQRMEGISDENRLLETEQGYHRLLWDYSDGNPRVALHFWLRSLVPDGDRKVRVRLFRAPDTETLEKLPEQPMFILAAIASHQNLSVGEAVATTRYPALACEGALERLRGDGIVRRDGGRYRITTHWLRAVIRFMRRKNLLLD